MTEPSDKAREDEKKDPFDSEYMGNIWGWRFSLIGLALLVLMLGLMVYRHYSLGIPFGGEHPAESPLEEAPADTLQEDSLSGWWIPERQSTDDNPQFG